jgi:uncharacterized surface protein with fasciclin (FAS1) repeats
MNLVFRSFLIIIAVCVSLASARLGVGEGSREDATATVDYQSGSEVFQHSRELKKSKKNKAKRKKSSSSSSDSSVSSESRSSKSNKASKKGIKKISFSSKKSSSSDDSSGEVEPTLLSIIEGREDEFSTFLSLAELAGIDDALDSLNSRRVLAEGGMTLFLPTNKAFEDAGDLLDKYTDTSAWGDGFLSSVLLFHVIDGSTVLSTDLEDGAVVIDASSSLIPSDVTVSTQVDPPQLSGPSLPIAANIAEVDNVASNGVFHVVDQVITPAFIRTDLLTAAAGLQVFTNFLDLVEAAGLTATLQEAGPFTVYAVPDAVFAELTAALGFDAVAKLKEDTDELKTILENHIVAGQVFCGCKSATATSVAGNALTIADITGDGYTVNGVATAAASEQRVHRRSYKCPLSTRSSVISTTDSIV